MSVIAVTGGFGTGKTTVAKMFRERGSVVVDVDALVRELEQPHQPAWKKIVSEFGFQILHADASINRPALAAIVFANTQQLQKLNAAVHPTIMKETKKRIRVFEKNKQQRIVVDIPLLFEVQEQAYFDYVVVVEASDTIVLKRIMKSRGLSATEINQRIRAQIPLKKKIAQADFVVDNNNDLKKTRQQVRIIFHKVF